MALSEKSFADELKVEGITFKGFGVIPKAVTLNPDLTIEAKAIYAYFASFAGGGSCAFPSRDKILSELKISKDRYYKHLKLLIDSGLLCVQKETGAGFTRNIYILKSSGSENGENEGLVLMAGLNSFGYGIIPKAVTVDPRLTIEAKGLYAYYAAFTGSGRECTPEVKIICYHLNISDKRYIKYRNLLEDLGYISVSRLHKDGHLGAVKVTLLDKPDYFSKKERTITVLKTSDQSVQNKDIQNIGVNPDTAQTENIAPQGFEPALAHQRVQNKDTAHQSVQNKDVQNQSVQNKDVQNQDTNNNSINNNKLNINNINNIKREEKIKKQKREGEKEDAPAQFTFESPVGSLTISYEEKEMLTETFSDIEGLFELAICSLSQRSTKPRSTFHFIWELGINKKWPRKKRTEIKRKEVMSTSEEDKLIEKWEKEDKLALEKKVRAFMTEEGISDYEKAYELYTARAETEAKKKLAAFLGR